MMARLIPEVSRWCGVDHNLNRYVISGGADELISTQLDRLPRREVVMSSAVSMSGSSSWAAYAAWSGLRERSHRLSVSPATRAGQQVTAAGHAVVRESPRRPPATARASPRRHRLTGSPHIHLGYASGAGAAAPEWNFELGGQKKPKVWAVRAD